MNFCPLCNERVRLQTIEGCSDRIYYKCGNCWLIFVDSSYYPSSLEEKQRYLKHHNSLDDSGYIDFLNHAITPALQFIMPGMKGLDYGCGPSPVLGQVLAKYGVSVDNYDPYFFPVLKTGHLYDFIFVIETAEHFFHPLRELITINSLLKPGGILTVRTELWKTPGAFKTWWYTRDFTHVCFYHARTFKYISMQFNLTGLYMDGNGTIVWRK